MVAALAVVLPLVHAIQQVGPYICRIREQLCARLCCCCLEQHAATQQHGPAAADDAVNGRWGIAFDNAATLSCSPMNRMLGWPSIPRARQHKREGTLSLGGNAAGRAFKQVARSRARMGV